MNAAEKQQSVTQLQGYFAQAATAFVVDSAAIDCGKLTALRRKLTPTGARLQVVKNTLARRAVEETPAKKLQELFQGPSTVIWSESDPVTPAKILADFARENEKFVIKGAFVDGELMKADGVEALSKLPSKEELIAKLPSLINAPATRLLQTINEPATSLVRVLEAQRAKLEGE